MKSIYATWAANFPHKNHRLTQSPTAKVRNFLPHQGSPSDSQNNTDCSCCHRFLPGVKGKPPLLKHQVLRTEDSNDSG